MSFNSIVARTAVNVSTPPSGITLRQQGAQVDNIGGSTSWSAPFASSLVAGSTVIIEFTYWQANDNTSVKVDGVDASVAVKINVIGDIRTELWYLNVPSGGAGVVTATFGSTGYGSIRAQEFINIANSTPVVYTNTADGTLSINYTTQSQGDNLIMTIAGNNESGGSGYWVPPSGYSLGLNLSDWSNASSGASAYKVVSSATGATVTWLPATGSANLALAIFKPV